MERSRTMFPEDVGKKGKADYFGVVFGTLGRPDGVIPALPLTQSLILVM